MAMALYSRRRTTRVRTHKPFRSRREFFEEKIALRCISSHHRMAEPLHQHDFTELVVVASGSCLHRVGDSCTRVSQGEVFAVEPGTLHGYEQVEDFHIYNILYDPAVLPLHDIETNSGYRALFLHEEPTAHLLLDEPELAAISLKLEQLHDILESDLAGRHFLGVARFMEIIFQLADYFSSLGPRAGRPDSVVLEKILSYMEQHYMHEITLAALADYAFLSVSTLHRLFIRGTGQSPMRFLNALRINNARRLLLNSPMPVSGVARAVGFADSNYFSSCFRKQVGCTPSEFRETALR